MLSNNAVTLQKAAAMREGLETWASLHLASVLSASRISTLQKSQA